jgi:hypothetical protein
MYFTAIVPHFCYPPGHMVHGGVESEGHRNPAENPELAAYLDALQQYEAQFDKAEKDPITLVSLADYIDLFAANAELDYDKSLDGKRRSRIQREVKVTGVEERINGKINDVQSYPGYLQGNEEATRVITALSETYQLWKQGIDGQPELTLAKGLMQRKTETLKTHGQPPPPQQP